jgi:hypothetical protein
MTVKSMVLVVVLFFSVLLHFSSLGGFSTNVYEQVSHVISRGFGVFFL